MHSLFEASPDPAWLLREEGYHPMREIDLESRFTVSNGFLGVRGARDVGRGPMWVSWIHTFVPASWPRTYVAGLFDTPEIEPPVPVLIPAGDWLRIHIRLNEERLLLRSGQLLSHCRNLDMRRGALIIDWRQRTLGGVIVRVRTLRLVSQKDRSLGLQLLLLDIEQDGIEVALEAAFEEAAFGLEVERLEQELGVWRTEQSLRGLAMAASVGLQLAGREIPATTPKPLNWRWRWTSAAGQSATFQRLVAVLRSDGTPADPGAGARRVLDRALQAGWRGVIAAHETAWADRWSRSNVEVDGDEAAQQALRFAIYHLNSAANPEDERVSIAARALTGDSYLGHVFWDTEIYLLPFYTMTWPEAARALLMYRYHTLPGARLNAARIGCRGALYAWESADTGEEATPALILGQNGRPVEVLCGKQQHHITADVAYAVRCYWDATHDTGFLLNAGAEILLETARFWVSRAQQEADGHSHIRVVIGPDEYHESVDDNAYTNVMARWNIRCALHTAALLQERWPEHWAEIAGRLHLDHVELKQWRTIAETLVTSTNPATGVIEQFAGFFEREEVDLARYTGRIASMESVLGRERIKGSQLIKQADVVTLLALLPEEFDAAAKAANFRYYERRCTHESSLSRPTHALVAARLGDTDTALQYFRTTAATDLAEGAGGSAGGIRIAALGGLWQAAILGFAGLSWRGEFLTFDPRLPAEWLTLAFRLQWRGRRLHIRVEQPGNTVNATLEAGHRMTLAIGEETHELNAGQTIRVAPR
jgi:trehalose/maltose hydrolase-like predicted phosphorylase